LSEGVGVMLEKLSNSRNDLIFPWLDKTSK